MSIDYEMVRKEAYKRARSVQGDEPMTYEEFIALIDQFERDIVEEIQEGWNE